MWRLRRASAWRQMARSSLVWTASELISLARDYIGAFQLNHAVLSGALLMRNGTKFSEAAGKIVANFKNDAVFSFDNLGRLSEVEFAV